MKATFYLLILIVCCARFAAAQPTTWKLYVVYIDKYSNNSSNDWVGGRVNDKLNSYLDSVAALDKADLLIMLASNKDTNNIFYYGKAGVEACKQAFGTASHDRRPFAMDAMRLRRAIYEQVAKTQQADVVYSYQKLYLTFFMPQSQAQDMFSKYNALSTLIDEVTSLPTYATEKQVDVILPRMELKDESSLVKLADFYQNRSLPTYGYFGTYYFPHFHLY